MSGGACMRLCCWQSGMERLLWSETGLWRTWSYLPTQQPACGQRASSSRSGQVAKMSALTYCQSISAVCGQICGKDGHEWS